LDLAVVFGQVLRRIRKEGGLTQEQLALEADIQRNYVSLIELGDSQPTIGMLFKLADALGTAPSAILTQVEAELRLVAKKGRR
jgi:transcriptional regulator with XRE-family HTH domain